MDVNNDQQEAQQQCFHDGDTFAKLCIKIGSVIRLYPLEPLSERELQKFYTMERFKLPPSIHSKNPESDSVKILQRSKLAGKYALKYIENGKYAPASFFQEFNLRNLTPEREIGTSMNLTLHTPPLTLTPMQSGLNIKHMISQLFILTSICSYIIFTEGNKKIQGLDCRREG
jgi:hypothetical protein